MTDSISPPRPVPEPAADEVDRWTAARRAPRLGDSNLLATARQWLRRLPARRRPTRLAAKHPRIVNRIAWCWSDPALSMQVLDDLLTDRRGGRDGFPAPIVLELRRLRRLNAGRAR